MERRGEVSRQPRALCRIAGLAAALAVFAACRREPSAVARLDVHPTTVVVAYSQARPLELTWTVDAPLAGASGPPTVFVHLLAAPGNVQRTFDHALPAQWQPGESITDTIRIYQSALGPPLMPGRYQLSVGLYDAKGRRWPIKTAGPLIDRFEYGVATVQVPADSADLPRFLFSSSWLAPETGTDRQVMARRWLAGPGTLKITGVHHAGTVWLSLRIPSANGEGSRLVLDPGAGSASVLVTAGCGEVEASLSGAGVHDVEVPVPFDPASDECEIRIQPNFYLTAAESFERRSVVLENLAWTPEGG